MVHPGISFIFPPKAVPGRVNGLNAFLQLETLFFFLQIYLKVFILQIYLKLVLGRESFYGRQPPPTFLQRNRRF